MVSAWLQGAWQRRSPIFLGCVAMYSVTPEVQPSDIGLSLVHQEVSVPSARSGGARERGGLQSHQRTAAPWWRLQPPPAAALSIASQSTSTSRAIMLLRYHAAMLPCCRATTLKRCYATRLPCCYATVLLRYHATALPRYQAARMPCLFSKDFDDNDDVQQSQKQNYVFHY